jgi:hypothetical protein
VNPEEVFDEDFVASKLAFVINGNFDDIKYLIRKRPLKYLPIMSKLSITTSEVIKQKLDEEKQAYLRGFIKKEEMVGPFIILSPN